MKTGKLSDGVNNSAFVDLFFFEFEQHKKAREKEIVVAEPLFSNSKSQVPCAVCKTRASNSLKG